MQGLPRSGGEKNYLEFVYRKPRFIVTFIFMVYTLIMVFLFLSPALSCQSDTFRARLQQTALFLANVCSDLQSPLRHLCSNLCRSSQLVVHRAYLVPYSFGCLLLPVVYLSRPWYSAQMGRPSSKCARVPQAHRPWADLCLRPAVSGRVEERAGPRRV